MDVYEYLRLKVPSAANAPRAWELADFPCFDGTDHSTCGNQCAKAIDAAALMLEQVAEAVGEDSDDYRRVVEILVCTIEVFAFG